MRFPDRRPGIPAFGRTPAMAPAFAAALAAMLLAGCGADRPAVPALDDPAIALAAAAVSGDEILAHIRVLASDEFEGRSPGGRGEELTVEYLIEQFQALGLEPGNPDGTYVQEVPLIGVTGEPEASFTIGGRTLRPSYPTDYVAHSRRIEPEVGVRGAELIFVGYGVEAPEYGWDDYKGVDVAGKMLVMLVSDPPVPHTDDPARLDPDMFRGEAMTYYGRWTYKYEIALEKGAAGAIIIHETGPAGYPYTVIETSFTGEQFDIVGGATNRLAVRSWVSEPFARELLAAAGQDFDALKAAAARPDFQPVELGGTADFHIRSSFREVQTRNVVARLPGRDPALRDEHVIYTAHWDHLGVSPDGQVYNGALDNASGTAGLLGMARAFTSLPEPPRRSILFLAVGAEESGLLGSAYYAANPLHPLEQTLANINLDVLYPWGRTRDVEVIGYGFTTLDDILREEAAAQGRVLVPEPQPEQGLYFRSDHFSFARAGVPALYAKAGIDVEDRPAGWGLERRNDWRVNRYHAPGDTVRADWDLAGITQDVELLFGVGYRVAEGRTWPEWAPDSEFRAAREAMLR